ncbi:MAG: molybdopterin-dependent oxidoreductase [Streptosporangiales bacterium]|nr:molybdopterin-dependent oxidoreductase [Streptosporangiales bacterium]
MTTRDDRDDRDAPSARPMAPDEAAYDRVRAVQWLRGEAHAPGLSRRTMLRLAGIAGVGAGLAGTGLGAAARAMADDTPGIVKPLPPEIFTVHGTNAETNFAALRGVGFHVPASHFFVRNHTSTAVIDEATWRLRLHGDGLHGSPTLERPVTFDYDQLRAMPSRTISAFVECAGNGRSFYTTQQGQEVPGTPWRTGGIGQAVWRGVPLRTVLRYAGLRPDAVDVMPRGLDGEFNSGGVNHGHVRRPLPIRKALDDVLLAYEMNGRPLPPDHGFPVRVVVPSWVGISSIKWVGDIEVSARPLFSPWNTDFYRLFGPSWPGGASAPLTEQVVKSAFELPWQASLPAGAHTRLHGRSWSGTGRVAKVEVSTDGGEVWRRARITDDPRDNGWVRWHLDWRPRQAGPVVLKARTTDHTGATQPETSPFNREGYLFGAVVAHPVTVT